MRRIPKLLTDRARALRNDATPSERGLWLHLRKLEPRFTRQLVIEPYIADFACRSARLVVEIDGRSHDRAEAYDARRDRFLRVAGWEVVRVSNTDASRHPEAIAAMVAAVAAERLRAKEARQAARTHPQLLAEEGGEKKAHADPPPSSGRG